MGQKTLSYLEPRKLNDLPAQIKLRKNVNTFKHDIKKLYFEKLQKENDTTNQNDLLVFIYLFVICSTQSYICSVCLPQGAIMKIRSSLTCIMPLLPQYC